NALTVIADTCGQRAIRVTDTCGQPVAAIRLTGACGVVTNNRSGRGPIGNTRRETGEIGRHVLEALIHAVAQTHTTEDAIHITEYCGQPVAAKRLNVACVFVTKYRSGRGPIGNTRRENGEIGRHVLEALIHAVAQTHTTEGAIHITEYVRDISVIGQGCADV